MNDSTGADPVNAYDQALQHLRRFSTAFPEHRGFVETMTGDVNQLERDRRAATAALEQCGDRISELQHQNADLGAQVHALESAEAERADPARGAEQVVQGGLDALQAMNTAGGLRPGGLSVLMLDAPEHGVLRLNSELGALLTGRRLRIGHAATTSQRAIAGIEGSAPGATLELWGIDVRGDVRITASPGFSLVPMHGTRMMPVRNAGQGVPL